MSYAEDWGFDAYWFCSEFDREESCCKCEEEYEDEIKIDLPF